jgi:hypothetical protein
MRIWTVHPKYLDPRCLVALWREALLAQKVLRGLTVGYKSHPQLLRFRAQAGPVAAMAAYLSGVRDEAVSRGYSFDASKIARGRSAQAMTETEDQLLYEWQHLKAKLQARSPEFFARVKYLVMPESHPLFTIVPGEVRDWERVSALKAGARR